MAQGRHGGALRSGGVMSLTGRFEFRKTWSGKLVLLVEEKKPRWFAKRGADKFRWREANLLDLAEGSMRPLMDLRKSQQRPEGAVGQPPVLRVVEPAKPNGPPSIAAAA